MKPQDVLVLLKLVASNQTDWAQIPLAQSLGMSQAEISQSLARSRRSALLEGKGLVVRRSRFLDFLQYGISIVYPVEPGAMGRGVPTSHSAPPLSNEIRSEDAYVWAHPLGQVRGQTIAPLYASAPDAALRDTALHELLALVDALRVGKAREQNLALRYLKERLL